MTQLTPNDACRKRSIVSTAASARSLPFELIEALFHLVAKLRGYRLWKAARRHPTRVDDDRFLLRWPISKGEHLTVGDTILDDVAVEPPPGDELRDDLMC